MAKKRLIGIVVREKEPASLGGNRFAQSFELEIGYRERGSLFITTPAIREKIAKTRLGVGRNIGTAEAQVNPEFREVILYSYYQPLLIYREMHGIGIANLLDLLLEKRFKKEFPGYKTRISSEPEPPRIKQVIKRKRDPGKTIPLETAYELTRRKVILDAKKHQPAREGVKRALRRIRKRFRRKKIRYF
jgi:hypothetical protein